MIKFKNRLPRERPTVTLNQAYTQLLQQNWGEASRLRQRLETSIERLTLAFPLSEKELRSSDEGLFEKLDAFRLRYAGLQDCLGNKLFRNILRSEDEDSVNMADTLSRMEKRQIIVSVNNWRELRQIRNAFSHDYPEAEKERAEALNLAWKTAPHLIHIMTNIHTYMAKQQFILAE